MEELSSYSQYLELIAVIIGTIKYRQFKEAQLKYVYFFLWYVTINEFTAGVSYPILGIPNYILYNVYFIIHFAFFLWWYSSLMFSTLRKKILQFFIVFFGIFWLVDAFFLQDFINGYLTYSYTLGTVMVTLAVSLYFIEMLNRDVILNITGSPYFWISFGLLVYCVTYLPFEIAITFLQRENFIMWSVVLFLINCIQYGCFAIAFIKAQAHTVDHKISS